VSVPATAPGAMTMQGRAVPRGQNLQNQCFRQRSAGFLGARKL